MPIRVICEGCGKGIKAPDKYAGTTARCPGCGQHLVIPAPDTDFDEFVSDTIVDEVLQSKVSSQAVSHREVGQSTTSTTPEGRTPADDQVACPYCAELIRAAAAKCRYCGEFLTGQKPTVTEATGKKWKFIQLIGAVLMLCGIIFFGGMFGFALLAADTELEPPWFFGLMATLGLIGLLVGVPCYIVGRVGAWWYHG
jgi:predicted RNA-binding Zn-ribbon protein involved in translation (DUF1610 family)